VLAEAIFTELLAGAPELDVSIESASVGPAFAGGHDARVAAAAAEAGLALPPRTPRAFDEVVDIVAFDLVLVMDHFDCEEVRP
jgi:protein-tyrosine-phosphatase